MVPKNCCLTVMLAIAIASGTQDRQINDHWIVSFSERFRLVTWDNAISLDETAGASRTFTRHRTQLGAIWAPRPLLAVRLQLANEFRYHVTPARLDFHFDEIFVDQLHLKINRLGELPLALTIGRQNIMLGEGFVVMDGHPLDGSRSIYFNAVRADWSIATDHMLTAFVSYQKETDAWLPVIHERKQALVEQPETGFGLYYSGTWSGRGIDGYFVHKRLDDNDAFTFKSIINTIGLRVRRPFMHDDVLAVVAEAALQFGKRGEIDRRAFGGYGYLEYLPVWASAHFFLPTALKAGIIYLSGDNADSDRWQSWDPMFARWPKWSESYIYTQIKEDAVAYWTNVVSYNATVRFTLTSAVDLQVDYHHLVAPQKADAAAAFPGGGGYTRGDLIIGKVSYKFDEGWSGHLLWEGFSPGDYYFAGADSYAWIRAELMFKY